MKVITILILCCLSMLISGAVGDPVSPYPPHNETPEPPFWLPGWVWESGEVTAADVPVNESTKPDFPFGEYTVTYPIDIIRLGFDAGFVHYIKTGTEILIVKGTEFWIHTANVCLRMQGWILIGPEIVDGYLLAHMQNQTENGTVDLYSLVMYRINGTLYNPWVPEGLPAGNCTSIQIVGNDTTDIVDKAKFYGPHVMGKVPTDTISRIWRTGHTINYIENGELKQVFGKPKYQTIYTNEHLDKAFIGDAP